MKKRLLCVFSLFILFSISIVAQTNEFPSGVDVAGVIVGLPAHSVCSVELSSNQMIATVPISTPCYADGTFQLSNVKRGNYQLMVHYGLEEYSQQVSLMAPHEELEIRIPIRRPTASEPTVSVANLRIPDKAKQNLHKAVQSLQHTDLNKASLYVAEALQEAPRFAEALTLQAVLQMARQDFRSALQTANHSAAIDPRLPMTQFVRASALNAMGDARQAQAAAEEGIRLDGYSWQGHFELAKSMMGQRNFRRALLEIDRIENVAPKDFAELFLLRATAMCGLGDIKGARANLNEFTKLSPGDVRATQLEQMLEGMQKP